MGLPVRDGGWNSSVASDYGTGLSTVFVIASPTKVGPLDRAGAKPAFSSGTMGSARTVASTSNALAATGWSRERVKG